MSQQATNVTSSAAANVAPHTASTNPPTTPKKRKSAEDTDTAQPAGDHRKRRRNRTTQSCLNCHGSKRMCDRKRPACGRCVKLGLSGICVYEVDDLNQRDIEKDETAHLKSRIAELEGFIREFKKKPHPRWAAELLKSPTLSIAKALAGSSEEGSNTNARRDSVSSSSDLCSPSRTCSLSTTASTSSMPATPRDQLDVPVLLTSPASDLPSFLFTSHSDKQAPFLSLPSSDDTDDFDAFLSASSASLREGEITNPGPEDDLERVFAQILQCDAKQPTPLQIPGQLLSLSASASASSQKCHCVKKSSAYSVVLELAPHIRRALDALSALPEHGDSPMNETCDYFKQLQSLDTATSALVECVSNCLTTNTSSAAYVTPLPSPHNGNFPASSTASSFDYLSKRTWPSGSEGPSSVNSNSNKAAYPFLSLPSQGPTNNGLWLRDGSNADFHGASPDRFMTWEPSSSPGLRSAPDWPRTIVL